MKTDVLAVMTAAAFTLGGCANNNSTAPTAKSANTNPTEHTVTRNDLDRSTRTDAASALQAADPAVGRGGSGH